MDSAMREEHIRSSEARWIVPVDRKSQGEPS